jgi:hypothetical protein
MRILISFVLVLLNLFYSAIGGKALHQRWAGMPTSDGAGTDWQVPSPVLVPSWVEEEQCHVYC